MTSEQQTETLEATYELPRVMEIAQIETAYEELLEFAKQGYSKFTLDAGKVALIDAAGIQLIVQFLLYMRGKDCQVEWINDSVQIYQIAAELGVEGQLDA
ncbi:MAG: lipid asymmetry maintenance protein MlaB [Pseudohongiellaceae bacterium]|jgi:anti-anti-sigma regulatory factor